MVRATSDWQVELGGWLEPFLERLGHKARQRMCPLYVSGLIGPGDRKSVQPMAERFAPNDYDQLHHFIAGGVWDAAPLERETARSSGQACRWQRRRISYRRHCGT
jgi:SRSO17 transposase